MGDQYSEAKQGYSKTLSQNNKICSMRKYLWSQHSKASCRKVSHSVLGRMKSNLPRLHYIQLQIRGRRGSSSADIKVFCFILLFCFFQFGNYLFFWNSIFQNSPVWLHTGDCPRSPSWALGAPGAPTSHCKVCLLLGKQDSEAGGGGVERSVWLSSSYSCRKSGFGSQLSDWWPKILC